MKTRYFKCPTCDKGFSIKGYWKWVLSSPFHWLIWDKETKKIKDGRLTKCPYCGRRSYMTWYAKCKD